MVETKHVCDLLNKLNFIKQLFLYNKTLNTISDILDFATAVKLCLKDFTHYTKMIICSHRRPKKCYALVRNNTTTLSGVIP